jgi:hypothetical protein
VKTPKEVRLLPGFVCEYCNHYNKFHRIAKVKVKPVYFSSAKGSPRPILRKPVSPVVPTLTSAQSDAIMALVALGYKKNDIESRVMSASGYTTEGYIVGIVQGNI